RRRTRVSRQRQSEPAGSWQPVTKRQLHSAGDASPPTALLLPYIWTICSVVAPCWRGASPPSVRRRRFATGCYARFPLTTLPSASIFQTWIPLLWYCELVPRTWTSSPTVG